MNEKMKNEEFMKERAGENIWKTIGWPLEKPSASHSSSCLLGWSGTKSTIAAAIYWLIVSAVDER
jgi:hypothetical protein